MSGEVPMMPKTLVIYKTKYGSTRQYAEWIAEAVSADILPLEKAGPKTLFGYDTVVFGSYVHIGKMAGADFVVKNRDALRGKQLFIFIVSSTPPEHPDSKAMLDASLPADIRGEAKIFQLMGRVGKLDIWDRLLMIFPTTAAWIKYKKSKSEQDRKELEKMKGFDEVDRKSTASIVSGIKGKK